MKKISFKRDKGQVPPAILIMPIAAIVMVTILVVVGVKSGWTFQF